jgi:tetratricopeptide (TPR) repeat protein
MYWHDLAAIGCAAVAAAHRLADQSAQVRAYSTLALAYTQLGRFDDAHTELSNVLELTIQTGDQIWQAHTRYRLAHLWERQGSYARALDHARKAFDLYQTVGDLHGQANALQAVGWCHARLPTLHPVDGRSTMTFTN